MSILKHSPLMAVVFMICGCTSLPEPKFEKHVFPKKDVYVGDVDRPYSKLGLVRTEVIFSTLDPHREFDVLCKNYYNKAVNDLLDRARKVGADAVIGVRTVVMLVDGKQEVHETPECSDEGEEGQVLAQGIAIKWKPKEEKTDIKSDSNEI